MVALIFILFDIEAIFLYPWALVYHDLNVFGFVEMVLYIVILLVGYIFLWKKGALDWDQLAAHPESDSIVESQENDKNPVVQKLREWDAQAVAEVIEFQRRNDRCRPSSSTFVRVAEFLATDPSLGFTFLSDHQRG